MSAPHDKPPPRMTSLGEWIVHRDTTSEVENPYWDLEEPEPHPDPTLGCVRRGVCCRTSPGWFAPGEAEAAAAAREMTPDEFVRTFLIIDGAEVDGEWVHVFAPVKVGREGAPVVELARPVDDLYRALRGTCVFFDGSGCGIYESRPYECRRYDCTAEPEDNPNHDEIARMWWQAEREG